MRIALLHPTYWPEVRRGSERLVHDLGTELAARGHEVTVLTTHEARPETASEDGMRVVRRWRPPFLRPLRWYEDHIANAPTTIWSLRRGGYDLAHAFHPADAWAAVQARRFGGPPVIFSFHGIPVRQYLVERRYRLEMLQATISGAAATTVLSEAAAETFSRYLLHEPSVLPGGVRCADFAVEIPRDPEPTLMSSASMRDPRKRSELLLDAFEELRARRSDVRLQLVRPRDPLIFWSTPRLPAAVSWVDADDTPSLARAYAGARASVLPAVDEAFGLVLIESLAAGTPAVAARSGACPEIIGDEAIGRLFEPDDAGDLVRAMEEVLDLGARPETATVCRERAADFDWTRVAEKYERLYESVLEETEALGTPSRTSERIALKNSR